MRSNGKEDVMFGEDSHGSIIQRGIDEALACQDMLERAPIKPSWASRIVAWITAAARSIAHRGMSSERQTTAATPHGA
jgi:hypothetical protein